VTRRADIVTDPVVGIIGPGRAGVGLALALVQAGYTVRLHGRRKKAVPKPLELTVGAADEPPAWVAQAGVLILAVRDDAISPLAEVLARAEAVRADQVVLHLSGVLGQEALARSSPPAPRSARSTRFRRSPIPQRRPPASRERGRPSRACRARCRRRRASRRSSGCDRSG